MTGSRLRNVVGRALGVVVLFVGFACTGVASAPESALTDVRAEWLPDEDKIVHWHWIKDKAGRPAVTGNAAWNRYLAFLEERLSAAGVVDIERNAWKYDRWTTSYWPDDSNWSLEIAGEQVDVAQAGANSGSTGPEGITAPLVLYRPGDPPDDIAGKIVVVDLKIDPAMVQQLEEADYEYHAPERSYPDRESIPAHRDIRSQSWHIFPQLMQLPRLIEKVRAGGAAGALIAFDAGREQMAGMFTFPVPSIYDVPTLLLDRNAGRKAVHAARDGAGATLRLEADVVESDAWQLIGYLPGRHYGTDRDEIVQLTTHTDGPSISQDNGPLGLLALVEYFSNMPQSERPRTLMVFLDCRHYMPGQEEAFHRQDYFVRNAGARENIVGVIGMEHLGQIEYVEEGDRLVRSERVDPSLLWTTNDDRMVQMAIEAVRDNNLSSAYVRNVDRPGVHGRDQGRWYGMASFARQAGLPAFAIMGTMGAYWATSSGIERLDPLLFRRQVATFVQLTAEMMTGDAGGKR